MTGCRHALVTGGAGFIGGHLTRALLDRGMAVTVLDNLSTGRRDRVPDGAVFVEGDVRDPSAIRATLENVDCVFHLAARVSIRDSLDRLDDELSTNLLGTTALLQCLPGHVRRFVFASSMAVYGESADDQRVSEKHVREPLSPYGVSKLAGELLSRQVLASKGIAFTGLRYFNTYGPGQRYSPYVGVVTIFVSRLLRGEPLIVFGDGGQRRDFVHVLDIVAGTVAALDGPPGVYNLGTGTGTSVLSLARRLVERIRPGTEIQFAPAVEGELRNAVADIGAAEAHLQYVPRYSLDRELDGLIDLIRSTG